MLSFLLFAIKKKNSKAMFISVCYSTVREYNWYVSFPHGEFRLDCRISNHVMFTMCGKELQTSKSHCNTDQVRDMLPRAANLVCARCKRLL
jgi:hypothetical protein